MDETCKDEICKEKVENLADESSNNESRTNAAKTLRYNEDDERAKQKETILSADFSSYQLTRTEISSSNYCDSKEISSKLSNLNSGTFIFFFFNFTIFIVLGYFSFLHPYFVPSFLTKISW